VVYAREIDGRELTLIVSGNLWRNSLIMMDEETGSLWSHVTGECLEGEFQGRRLESIPSVQTNWSDWRAAHPQTKVLEKPGPILAPPYQRYYDDPDRNGMFRTFWLQDRMGGKVLVHGMVVGPHAAALVDTALAAGDSHEFELGSEKITVTRDADGGVRAVTAAGDELQVRTAYWFAWSTFYPNTTVVD